MPNKLLGQHFLRNQQVLQKIIQAIAPQPGEIILEIGPGHGELTVPLATLCQEKKCALITIEKDPALQKELAEKFRDAHVEILGGDALTFLTSGQFLTLTKDRPYAITGNIPYYLTGHLLRLISESLHQPSRCIFLVQKEVAERMTARPPKMNRLAASVQFWAEPTALFSVSKKEFSPQPKVDSTVVKLERRNADADAQASPDHYYAAVRALFAQPRKTILNNLAAVFEDKDRVVSQLEELGLQPQARPQDLTVSHIALIAKHFWG